MPTTLMLDRVSVPTGRPSPGTVPLSVPVRGLVCAADRPGAGDAATVPVVPAKDAPRRYCGRRTARHAAPSRVRVLLPVLLLGVSGAAVGVLTLPSGSPAPNGGSSRTSPAGTTALGPTARAAPATATATAGRDSGPLLHLSSSVDTELAFADAAATGAGTTGPTGPNGTNGTNGIAAADPAAPPAPGTVVSAAGVSPAVVVPPLASTSPLARSRSVAPVLPDPTRTVDGREILGSKAALRAAATPSVVQPAVGPITSPFGYRWGSLHAGIDFGVPVGTPIVAVMDGVVHQTSSSAGGYGNLTVLQHADGTLTYYAHQSKILVAEGQVVTVGELIGLSGNTGHSTGPHLHFEVHPGGGDPVDPRVWLGQHGITL